MIAAVRDAWPGELIVEHSPKESHEKSNGTAELAVQQVHGLARTMKEQVEDMAQVKIPQKHPLLAWLIEHGGTLITLFAKGSDGFTPIYRLKGRPWRVALPSFGETVEFRMRTHHKLDPRRQA